MFHENVNWTILLISSALFPPPIITVLYLFFVRWFRLVPPAANYLTALLLVLMVIFAGSLAFSIIAGGEFLGYGLLTYAGALMATWTVAAYALLYYLWQWAFGIWNVSGVKEKKPRVQSYESSSAPCE